MSLLPDFTYQFQNESCIDRSVILGAELWALNPVPFVPISEPLKRFLSDALRCGVDLISQFLPSFKLSRVAGYFELHQIHSDGVEKVATQSGKCGRIFGQCKAAFGVKERVGRVQLHAFQYSLARTGSLLDIGTIIGTSGGSR